MNLFKTFAMCMALVSSLPAQEAKPGKPKKVQPPFKWVNPLPARLKLPGLRHATFTSPSMKVQVGYCIYLPPSYWKKTRQRFPVIYYLHGGRPGNETRSVRLAEPIDAAIRSGKARPMIYVFINGGAVSHYNYPQKNSLGEDVFIKELIPHIDKTYRTVAARSGRGLEGFSQGGRGTTRIMFRHPQLFASCAPGGAGHATEKRISEEGGRESARLKFAPGYNTYDLARAYSKNPVPKLNILIHVGTRGFNYQNNLAYMKFLDELKIPYQKLIVEDAPHSAWTIYKKSGLDLMRFHARHLLKNSPETRKANRQEKRAGS